MANSYWLMSMSGGLVMDVRNQSKWRGTPLQVYAQKSPPAANQLWNFERSSEFPDFFYITINLGNNLVVDIDQSTDRWLGTWTQKTGADATNQLWQFVPLVSDLLPQIEEWAYFQSLGGTNLVIDVTGVTGGNEPPQTPLEVWTKNVPATGNQIWIPLPAPGNSYQSKITGIDFAGDAASGPVFNVVGQGFKPLGPVVGHWNFDSLNTELDTLQGGLVGQTDIFGNLSIELEPFDAAVVDGYMGWLSLQIDLSIPIPNPGVVAVRWDGSGFGPIQTQ